MPNVTIALSERLIAASREYAQRHGTSLNALIRELLDKTVNGPERKWPDAFIAAVDRAHGNSRGWKWNRDEIYERDDKK